jgi:hypothetical protein
VRSEHGHGWRYVTPASTTFVLTHEGPLLGNTDDLLRSKGLDPSSYVVTHTQFKEWDSALKDGGSQRLQLWSLTLRAAPHRILPQPAVHVPRVSLRPLRGRSERPRTIAVLSDHQASYADPDLHRASLEALRYFRAKCNLESVVHLGDLVDFPTISKHPAKPGEASVQECIDAGYGILRDLSEVGGVPISFIPGNHEFRLQQYMYDRARDAYGLTPVRGARPEPHEPAPLRQAQRHPGGVTARLGAR